MPASLRAVIVIGSGAAGFAAAAAARQSGSRVTLLEASATVGGTTAMSGGVAWIPGGPRTRALGFKDNREQALTYLRGLALGDVDDDLVVRFVDKGPGVLDAVERTTPIRWRTLAYPTTTRSDQVVPMVGARSSPTRSLSPRSTRGPCGLPRPGVFERPRTS